MKKPWGKTMDELKNIIIDYKGKGISLSTLIKIVKELYKQVS